MAFVDRIIRAHFATKLADPRSLVVFMASATRIVRTNSAMDDADPAPDVTFASEPRPGMFTRRCKLVLNATAAPGLGTEGPHHEHHELP